MNELFRKIASSVSSSLGSPIAFLSAAMLVVIWALCGPMFNYSDAWQLVINTSTTIGTFLMIFVLQNTQTRDTKAINIKLDELLRAIEGARTGLATVGDLSDEELDKLEREFRSLAATEGNGINPVARQERIAAKAAVVAKRALSRKNPGTASGSGSGA